MVVTCRTLRTTLTALASRRSSWSNVPKRTLVFAPLTVPYTSCQRRSVHLDDRPWTETSQHIVKDTAEDDGDLLFVGDEEYTNCDLESLDIQTIHENQNSEEYSGLPAGLQDGYYVVKQYSVPAKFELEKNLELTDAVIQRLNVTPENTTLPVALMLMDPEEYPSLSRARKACRKGTIILHRGPLSSGSIWDQNKIILTHVADRVYPGDVLGKQVRMSHGPYSALLNSYTKPHFDVPVIYEGDHFAIVNKPAGIIMYPPREGCHQGQNNLRFALPYFLTPPKSSTVSILLRPTCCHRIDKPTSGLVLVAKTRPALVNITRQFEDRKVNKTYTAIINGPAPSTPETSLPSQVARDMGWDDVHTDDEGWQLTNVPLDGKEAVTIWRAIGSYKSCLAKNSCVTLVELKPKTGRYHQLRRHMAHLQTPIVGDTTYGTPYENKRWSRGLMLCSNKVTLSHPYFNTEEGQKEWDQLDEESKYAGGMLHWCNQTHSVLVTASIDLPNKFRSFLATEENKWAHFNMQEKSKQETCLVSLLAVQ